MRRKNFIRSILPAALAGSSIAAGLVERKADPLIPPFLQPGNTVGICSPAGSITMDYIQPAILQLQNWGYKVKVGSSIGKKDFSFGGTDKERTADLQQMLDDDDIHAILAARGGYGTVRIVDDLDFKKFKEKPKWIIGFSDMTVLLCHIFSRYYIAGIHSKMCNSFPASEQMASKMQQATIESINDCLIGKPLSYTTVASVNNKQGSGIGPLIGGNLRTLENLAGSVSSPCTAGCILFVEDTGEYLYSIDRMFYNLKRSGKLHGLAGLIIGGFKIKPDDEGEEFGRSLEEIVLEKVSAYNYPVCFNFPVGHQVNNFALRTGVKYQLLVDVNGGELKSL